MINNYYIINLSVKLYYLQYLHKTMTLMQMKISSILALTISLIHKHHRNSYPYLINNLHMHITINMCTIVVQFN